MVVISSEKAVHLQSELLVRRLEALGQYEWLQYLYEEWSENN